MLEQPKVIIFMSEHSKFDTPTPASSSLSSKKTVWSWLFRIGVWLTGLALAGFASLLLVIAIALAMAFPNLPDISACAYFRLRAIC
jgi:penicillin-binding protein 1A